MVITTIKEDIKNFKNWHAELISQIPETIEYRTEISFIVFSLLEKEATFHLRSLMSLSFVRWPFDFDLTGFSNKIREQVEKTNPKVALRWWRWRPNCQQHMPPESCRSFSEAWDIKDAALNEELEKERIALRKRLERIHKAYAHLKAVDGLASEDRSLMSVKRLLQAQAELEAAIKLIKRGAKCRAFNTDLEALRKKIILFFDQPGVEIKFTYL